MAPLFVTVTLGTIEFGNAFQRTNVLSSCLREGGRLAAMEYKDVILPGQTPNDKVLLDIRNLIKANGLPGDLVTLEIVHADGPQEGSPFVLDDPNNEMKLFRINATLDYTEIDVFPAGFMQGTVLEESIVMRLGAAALAS